MKNGAPLSYLVACHIELLFYGRLGRFCRSSTAIGQEMEQVRCLPTWPVVCSQVAALPQLANGLIYLKWNRAVRCEFFS